MGYVLLFLFKDKKADSRRLNILVQDCIISKWIWIWTQIFLTSWLYFNHWITQYLFHKNTKTYYIFLNNTLWEETIKGLFGQKCSNSKRVVKEIDGFQRVLDHLTWKPWKVKCQHIIWHLFQKHSIWVSKKSYSSIS